MSARIGLDNPGFQGRLRYQNRGSSYVRRSVLTGTPQQQVFDIVPVQPSAQALAISPGNRTTVASQATDWPAQTVGRPVNTTSAQPALSISPDNKKHINRQALALYVMAALLFAGGGAVAVNGLLTNRHVEAQVSILTKTQNDDSNQSNSNPPAVKKPSSESIKNYIVAPNMPRYVDIPKLGQHARVVSLGTKASGALATPGNVYDIGWYNGSNLPGQPGAMLLDGHVSSWTAHGTFYELKKLVSGDIVKIERGDGKVFTYKVVKSKLFDHNHVDMKSAVRSVDAQKQGLNMITCAGKVIPGTSEFDKRLIVYAVLQ